METLFELLAHLSNIYVLQGRNKSLTDHSCYLTHLFSCSDNHFCNTAMFQRGVETFGMRRNYLGIFLFKIFIIKEDRNAILV